MASNPLKPEMESASDADWLIASKRAAAARLKRFSSALVQLLSPKL
jgi:hypothetical protein